VDEHGFDDHLDPHAYRYVAFKSHQLAGRYGFSRDDAEDIQQELLLDLLRRSRSYDGRRCARQTFAHRVVENRASDLIAFQTAACRDFRICRLSLDAPVGSIHGEPFTLADMIADTRPGHTECDWRLRWDVRQAIAALPEEHAAICKLLLLGENALSVAARTRASRATLYRRLRKIRRHFDEAGLRRYLR